MADPSKCPPLTRESVRSAHDLIKPCIHRTPVLTSQTLSRIVSTPQTPRALIGTPFEGHTPARPKINLFFKCENQQKVGAFKARGAFHALLRLVGETGKEEVRRRGVCTHSSGNHAQALAFAARTLNIPAHIVMPKISTPSKIAGTKSYGANVIFSGSTSQEREAVIAEVMKKTGAILIPPYDHPDIILGQGTSALEMEEQIRDLVAENPDLSAHHTQSAELANGHADTNGSVSSPGTLDAVIVPLGGGGQLSGIAAHLAPTPTLVFGAEPSYQGADDARRGLESGQRIFTVSSLTIADGLRTPVGDIPWSIISDKEKVHGVYSVTEEQIKMAMRLVLERLKVWVEPSACVGLAVLLFDEAFRTKVPREGWDVGVVLSGGNTTVEAVVGLFGKNGEEKEREREEGKMGVDGARVAENVAG